MRRSELARARESQCAIELQEIVDYERLRELAPEWHELWLQSESGTVFQRPEWLLPWCQHLASGEPRVLAVRRNDVLIGLAPFILQNGAGQRALRVMGCGVSDYLDVLIAQGERENVQGALEHWLSAQREFDTCEWTDLPPGSVLLTLADVARPHSRIIAGSACPGLPLPEGSRELRAVLPRKKHQDILAARKKASREAEVTIARADAEGCDELLSGLFHLHSACWRARGEQGVLADQRVQAFHRAAANNLRARAALLLAGLRLGERLIAVVYGFFDRSALRYYLSGFEPTLAHLSPGTLIVAYGLEAALEHGCSQLDFMRGAEPYKYTWGAHDWLTLQVRHTST